MVGNRALVVPQRGHFVAMEQLEILVGDSGNATTCLGTPADIATMTGDIAPHDLGGIDIDHGFRGRLVGQGKGMHGELHGNNMGNCPTLLNRESPCVGPGGCGFRYINIAPDALVLSRRDIKLLYKLQRNANIRIVFFVVGPIGPYTMAFADESGPGTLEANRNLPLVPLAIAKGAQAV